MLRILTIAGFLAVVAALGPGQARAQGPGPWCAVSTLGWNYVSRNCSFWSFEACYPHITGGNRGFCEPNPDFRGPIPGLDTFHRRHHRWR